ncbi:MAG: ATP-binding cassette domain-containing protein [Acutalibacteraceae bacterium]|nr:ATP-binding cassette domain-containing protein [Acutalibacteraceae bacterium]
MIEVKNLIKTYGDKNAVDGISFSVSKGEVLGFLGPNGAGKSTTMNILTGYLSATDGTVSIAGFDILENPNEAKKSIGYLPEKPPLYQDMTVKEYLDFVYNLKKVKLPKGPHIKEICRLVKISNVYNRVIKHLSKGYQQRVGIAQALIGNPSVLILDEPTVGLDPQQIIEIRNLIKQLGRNHTIILSSHILSEIQAVCQRIIIISDGKIVADGTTSELSQNLQPENKVLLQIKGNEDDIVKIISSIKGVKSVVSNGETRQGVYEFTVSVEEGTDIREEIFKRMADRKWPILTVKTNELSLEEIFLKLVESNTTKKGNTK